MATTDTNITATTTQGADTFDVSTVSTKQKRQHAILNIM